MNRRNLLIACGTALTLAAAVFFTMKPDHSESAAAADYFDPLILPFHGHSRLSWKGPDLLSPGWTQLRQRSTVGIMFSVRKVQTSIPPAMQRRDLPFIYLNQVSWYQALDWDAELNLDAVYAGSLPVDAGDLIARSGS